MISIYIQMSHKLLLNMRASWCSFSFNWLLYSWCRQKIARLSTLENCHTYALINKKSWMSLSLLQQLTTKVAVLSTNSNKLNSNVFGEFFVKSTFLIQDYAANWFHEILLTEIVKFSSFKLSSYKIFRENIMQ